MTLELRAMTADDYPACVAIHNRIYPDGQSTVEEWRHAAAVWDHQRYWLLELVGVDAAGDIVGYGRASHMPWEFHPRKFILEILVDPDHRRRGHGATLYDRLTRETAARDAIGLRAYFSERNVDGARFVEQRGFVVMLRERRWRLDVAAVDLTRFANAEPRVAAQGITIVTLADELHRDPAARQGAFDCFTACHADVPAVDTMTTQTYDRFVKEELAAPGALLDGFFLAKRDGAYLGVSNLFKSLAEPGVLRQGMTGVRREQRGQGVAMALKVATVRYAQQRGYHDIRTANAATNDRMLAINHAFGFVEQAAWLEYEKQRQ